MAKADECLFLLEILLDKIIFKKSPCFSDRDFKTCVSFTFPTLPPLEICDDDSDVQACTAATGFAGPYVRNYNVGKSFLFALKEEEIDKVAAEFNIGVSVYKSLPCSCFPTKIMMGECTLPMSKSFTAARSEYCANNANIANKSVKDTFKLVNEEGVETGDILIFARISCFGQLIVTRFQGTNRPLLADENFSEKNPDIMSCDPLRPFRDIDDPCVCGPTKDSDSGTTTNFYDDVMGPCIGGVADPSDPFYNTESTSTNVSPYVPNFPKSSCCPQANRIVFKMPENICHTGHEHNSFLKYSDEGVGVITEEPSKIDYPWTDQIIKLRVGKIVEGPDFKSNLDLQFITTKANAVLSGPTKISSIVQSIGKSKRKRKGKKKKNEQSCKF